MNVKTYEEVAQSQGPTVWAGICIANHMLTGEIIDLANERRLSAALDFTHSGAELLILNGGSRAEEFTVITTVRGRIRKDRRAAYCVDSGTSMQLTLALAADESARNVTLRVIGGHGEMLLSQPTAARPRRVIGARGWSTLAAAMILALLAGGRLDAPSLGASADPEPAAPEPPLVKANVSLLAAARLPSVVARARIVAHPAIIARPAKVLERRFVVASAVMPKHVDVSDTPEPRITDLHVPSTAKSGDFVPVTFGAVGRQVKIVASIGPTIVSKTIVAARRGVIAIRSPKSDLDSRVMTVRAYAQDGNRTSTLQAMVILVHP